MRKTNPRVYLRVVVVALTFAPLLVTYVRDWRRWILFGDGREVTDEGHERRAKRLKATLLDLGPTFIKLGQTLSTRPDLLPSPYIRELEGLQDDVPPADWEEVEPVLTEDLGPVDEVFEEFDRTPISGASLGQVYRARIAGEDVAVKIRRPDIERQVEVDLAVVELFLPLFTRFLKENRAFSVENLFDQLSETIQEEMDYDREAETMHTIGENFADDDRVIVPAVIDEYSTERVLTMEFLDGVKISELDRIDEMGVDRVQLSTNARQIYLKMILIHGTFHADPHPGNLAVAEDGTIVMYDYGMANVLTDELREDIIDMYVALAANDTDQLLDAMVSMGTLDPRAAEEARDELEELIEVRIQDIRGEDVEFYRMNDIVQQIEDSIYDAPFKITKEMALVMRVAMIGEGVCVMLDPTHDIVEVTADFLADEGYLAQEIYASLASTEATLD